MKLFDAHWLPLSKSSVKISMGDLSFQHKLIWPKLKLELDDIFSSGDYVGGSRVNEFEKDFAQYIGANHCIGVGNGTDALEISLKALALPPGSKVIVPANSFVATAEAVVNVGLTPLFVDVCDDFSIDLAKLTKLQDDLISAIIVVHLYGYPQDLEPIKQALGDKSIKILEDCAQAQGAKVNGKHVGNLGDIGAFSFYPGKNLGALGDAGAIVTNNSEIANLCRRISNHGRLSKFDHEIIGRNSRLDAIQATVLSLKLQFLDEWNARRKSNAAAYRELLANIEGLVLPPHGNGDEVYHHFVVRTKKRTELISYLADKNISTGIHYPEPISAMKAFKYVGPDKCPTSDSLSGQILSLPVAEHLTRSDIEKVANQIKRFFGADTF